MPTFKDPAFHGEAHDTEFVPGGVVELRVHGVNGGTPEQNLDDPHPIQVAGDDTAGFYRRRSHLNTGPEMTVEAYNWLSTNSKRSSRIYWVFLLPFALANLAGWVLPKGFLATKRRHWVQSAVRLLGLVITALIVLAFMEVFVDLLAVQCGGSVVCRDRVWLGWFDSLMRISDLASNPVRRAILFTALPAAGLGWIFWQGRRSARQYEEYEAGGTPQVLNDERVMDEARLGEVECWQAPDGVAIQRRLHLGAGLAIIAATLAAVVRETAAEGGAYDAERLLAWIGFGLAAVAASGLVGAHWLRRVPSRRAVIGSWAPPLVAAGTLVAVGVVGWLASPGMGDQPPLEAVRNGLASLAVLGLAIVLFIGILVRPTFLFLAIVPISAAISVVIRDNTFSWVEGLSYTGWMSLELGMGLLFILIHASRNNPPPGGGSRLYESTAGIYFGLVVMSVLAVGAVFEAGAAFGRVAPGLPLIAYLAVQFVIQVRRGTDLPASEGMRAGIAAVVAGLALTSALTLTAGATVLVAQRLGTAYAHTSGPQANVQAFMVDPEITVAGDVVTIEGCVAAPGVAQPCSPADSPSPDCSLAAGCPVILHVGIAVREDHIVGDRAVVIEVASGVLTDPLPPPLDGITKVILRDLVLPGKNGRAAPGAVVAVGDEIGVDGGVVFYPAELAWYAVAAFAGFLLFAVSIGIRLIVLWWFRWRKKRSDLAEEYRREWITEPVGAGKFPPGDAQAMKRLARRATFGRLSANPTDDADWLLSTAVFTTLTVGSVIVWSRSWGDIPQGFAWSFIGFAATAITVAWIGLIWVVRRGKGNAALRRQVGMLWDVTAFFPRRFHPLAPPCYADRTVLDLRERIISLRRNGAGVVLIAHSEGSLLATVALMTLLSEQPPPAAEALFQRKVAQPSGNELEGIYFITYGCMLRRLFGRAWPAHLPLEDLQELKVRLGDASPAVADAGPFTRRPIDGVAHWMNFGRYTDYLGGRVFSEVQVKPTSSNPCPERADERCDDIFFRDPTRGWKYEGETGGARMWRHSFSYENDDEDPRFRQHVWEAAATLGDPSYVPTPVMPERLELDDAGNPVWVQRCVCHP